VDAVRLQRGRPDAAPDADAVPGHHLVADRADDGGHHHDAEVGDPLGVEEAVDRLVPGEDRRARDEEQDHDAGHVLRLAVPIGEARRRGATPEPEGQPQRHRGQRVGRVVQGVAQEGHRAAGHHDQGLDARGEEQDDEGEGDGPDAVAASLQRLVERVLRVRECGATSPLRAPRTPP